MKKMNYSNYEENEEKVEMIPASSVEVLETRPNMSFSSISTQSSIDSMANAISPVAALTSVLNTALGAITDIGKCITIVAVEKEKTKQIEAAARVQIEESIQQTNRIRIQEQEQTDRLIIQCKADLKTQEYELKKLCETNRSREVEINQNHKFYMEQLDNIQKIIENVMKDKEVILKHIPNVVNDSQKLEQLLHSLNDTNTRLVELSRGIIEIKKG